MPETRRTSLFPDRPKTITGWIGMIMSFSAIIGLIMGFGAWVYRVESLVNDNSKIQSGIDKINDRLDSAVIIIDKRFKSNEETQTDLRIAIEVAAELEKIRSTDRPYLRSTRRNRPVNNDEPELSSLLGGSSGGMARNNNPSPSPSPRPRASANTSSNPGNDSDDADDADGDDPVASLEDRLKKVDDRLKKNEKKSFKF